MQILGFPADMENEIYLQDTLRREWNVFSRELNEGEQEKERGRGQTGSDLFIHTVNALWRDHMVMFNVTLICIVINAQSDCRFQVCIIRKVPSTSGPGCINPVFAQTPCVLLSPHINLS